MPSGSEELPTGAAKSAMVRAMFDTIASRYDLVNALMTFGLDRGWRRRALDLLDLAPGCSVLDLACGTGDLARELCRREMRVLGIDLSLGMLAASRPGCAPLVQGDAAKLPIATGRLDGVVSGFAIRNFADLAGALREAARVTRPGGRLALLEVDTPRSALLAAGHRLWFEHGAPAIGAILSDRDAYHYLPASVAYLPERKELLELVERAGFVDVTHHRLTGGVVQIVTGTRAGGLPLLERDRAASARPPG